MQAVTLSNKSWTRLVASKARSTMLAVPSGGTVRALKDGTVRVTPNRVYRERRGFKVRLYPTAEQREQLTRLENDLRVVWNWLVKIREEGDKAAEAFAIREGLVSARPTRPADPAKGTSSEDTERVWQEYRASLKDWYQQLRTVLRDREDLARRGLRDWMGYYGAQHDYQMLKRVASWYGADLNAHLLQKLAKDYAESFKAGRRPPKFKRRHDPMPIGVRSGHCLDTGRYGSRGQNPSFYNCQIRIAGMKIRGRLPGRLPPGDVLEGVRVVFHGGMWWACVIVDCAPRVLPDPVPGSVVGIDVGLDNLVAMSGDGLDARGTLVLNPRNRIVDEQLENLREAAKDTGDDHYARRAARLEAKLARRVRHVIYNEILKPLAQTETIVVEKLNSKIGQMGSRKVSAMRTIVALLKERYGDRVREVSCGYTSQDCSQCGLRSKESWSYDHGPWGECPGCGHSEQRDINAARNIRARGLEPLLKTE